MIPTSCQDILYEEGLRPGWGPAFLLVACLLRLDIAMACPSKKERDFLNCGRIMNKSHLAQNGEGMLHLPPRPVSQRNPT